MSVASKINLVMADVSNIAKDGRSQQGYNYLSEEALTNALHHACAKHGLVFIPGPQTILSEDSYPVSNNKLMFRVRIAASYTLIDSDGDGKDSQPVGPLIGEGSDMGDKACNKAMTAAYKYALRETFMISTGDDPDATATEPAKGQAQRRPQPTARREVQAAAAKEFFCTQAGCGQQIVGNDKASAEQIANESIKRFGKVLCPGCGRALAKELHDIAHPAQSPILAAMNRRVAA